MKRSKAEIVREYGPYPRVPRVNGVTYDGQTVWAGCGDSIAGIDAQSGALTRTLPVPAHAGTAFDGRYLYQISGSLICKVDPESGSTVSSIPAPGGVGHDSGLAWAEGFLWVGQYPTRKIHLVDPHTGAIVRTLESDRFVTGVSWVDGELWHGTFEDDRADIRHIDASSGEILEVIEMPDGVAVSGLESDGAERFFCGGGASAKIRVVKRGTHTT